MALTCAALLLGLGAASAAASETCEGDNLALRATPIASSTIGGRETRQFDFPELTTTRIRLLIEEGATSGWSWLDEIEAYDTDGECEPPVEQCENIALDATPIASSTIGGFWPLSGVNNGRADTDWTEGFWNDNTNGVWPDWVGVEWSQPRTIDRIIVRVPLMLSGYSTGAITLARSRVQYYDDSASAWRDVVGRSGQDNPILDWIAAELVPDGRETRQFDFPELTTTRIRLLIEEGATSGWSWLDEIEAYDTDAECGERPAARNLALPANGGEASASSVHSGGTYPVTGVNNGTVEDGPSGYWNDGTNGLFPDWVAIEWDAPVTLDHIVATIPIARPGFPVGERTLERARVQYYDDSASAWRDVVGRSGQDNPILDWTGPLSVPDGSESRRFDVGTLTTSSIRVLIEEGSTDGWSWLAEIEAWGWA